jgi:hypothetical protein
MFKSGKKIRRIQKYKCENGHLFKSNTDSAWSDPFIVTLQTQYTDLSRADVFWYSF